MSKVRLSRDQARKRKTEDLFVRANEQWEQGKLHSAFRLFLAAAKAGDTGAQVNLGYFYDVGVGIKPNRAAALYWYKKAYRRRVGPAASNIGTIFRDEQRLRKALSWFRQAVKLGDGGANLEIAKIFLHNDDVHEAARYLEKVCKARSATEGSKEEARRLLTRLRTGKLSDRPIRAKAVEASRRAN